MADDDRTNNKKGDAGLQALMVLLRAHFAPEDLRAVIEDDACARLVVARSRRFLRGHVEGEDVVDWVRRIVETMRAGSASRIVQT